MKFKGHELMSANIEAIKTLWYIGLFAAGVSLAVILAAPFVSSYIGMAIVGAAGIAVSGGAFYHLIKEHWDKYRSHIKSFMQGIKTKSPKKQKQRGNTIERHPTYTIAPNANEILQKMAQKDKKKEKSSGMGLIERIKSNISSQNRSRIKEEQPEKNRKEENPDNYRNLGERDKYYQPDDAPALCEKENKAKREKVFGTLRGLGRRIIPGKKKGKNVALYQQNSSRE